MTFLFDVDDTICTIQGTDYPDAKPIPEMVDIIRDLYGAGHTIYFLTGRGFMGGLRHWPAVRKATLRQLEEWGVPHHGLYSKPACDVLIDDKATNVADFRLIIRLLSKEPS